MLAFMKRYSGFFLLVIGIIGMVILNTVNLTKKDNITAITTIREGEIKGYTSSVNFVFVDVKGAVRYPAVYRVAPNVRIEGLIEMAGGALENADLSEINLAKTVYDQMVLYIPFSQTLHLNDNQVTDIYVDIKGAVRYPGVYKVKSTFRVYDAIMHAGGFASNANTSEMNLSQYVSDQMIIEVPFKKNTESSITTVVNYIYVEIKGEVIRPGLYRVDSSWLIKDVINLAGGVKLGADLSKINLNQGIVNQMQILIPVILPTQPVPPSSTNTNDTVPSNTKININTATIDQLDTLKGIGYVLAQRIIDYRAEYGYFESIEDIMKVSGIKDSIYDQIKNDITV
jgi:competence protein ComEA